MAYKHTSTSLNEQIRSASGRSPGPGVVREIAKWQNRARDLAERESRRLQRRYGIAPKAGEGRR